MKFVMERLDHIKDDVEVWNSIPSTLRNQIIALNKAVKSSIIGRGQTKEAIFSSVDEFIAILNDTLNCHKERLREAKERQEEIIEDRLREGRVSSGSGRFVLEKDVLGGSVADAAKKIKRQEERVNTLQAFYNEQKEIFAKDRQSVEQFQGMFQL
jgi:ribosome-associated translation inhibitor RaiA